MVRDLDGLLVVSVEQAVAAPYASGRLADAGARVIKVERPEGDFARGYDALVNGGSAYFVWLNRGKESVRLNLKQETDLAILARMISSADIFIQNLAPGAVERMGLGIEELRRRFPKLICCSISGYGQDGPYRDQKAYDLLIQAESGLCAINGTPEAAARVGVSVCDIAAGMSAHAAILQALIGRYRTGEGRAIDVSLYHAMADWMNVPYLQYRYGGKPPKRQGLQHPTLAPYGAFECADGKIILISIQNEREWSQLCRDALEHPEWLDDQRFQGNIARVTHREDLDGLIGGCFRQWNRQEAIERLSRARIAYGRLSDLDDLLKHPQNRLIQVKTDQGEIELLSPAAVVRGERPGYGKVPSLGEHDAEIREEFAN